MRIRPAQSFAVILLLGALSQLTLWIRSHHSLSQQPTEAMTIEPLQRNKTLQRHRKPPSLGFFVFAQPGASASSISWASEQERSQLFVFVPSQTCEGANPDDADPDGVAVWGGSLLEAGGSLVARCASMRPSVVSWDESPGWWCAQRDYLRGVQGLVHAFPGADYYLLVDQDTVVFPHMLRHMVELLHYDVLGPHEDLYMGDTIQILDEDVNIDIAIVMSGGGVLLRGPTLRRASREGSLGNVSARQDRGDLCYWHSDWALAEALRLIGVRPRAHRGFVQFANEQGEQEQGKGCPPTAVACHSYNFTEQLRLLKGRTSSTMPRVDSAQLTADWATPCYWAASCTRLLVPSPPPSLLLAAIPLPPQAFAAPTLALALALAMAVALTVTLAFALCLALSPDMPQ